MFGAAMGFVMAWAQLSDPQMIGNMLLLREPDVFLLMGSGIAVAALGMHALRRFEARALVTREPIAWTLEAPQRKHVVGSVLFGLGWSVAGTCPGPVAAMIGQGKVGGIVVAAGLVSGVALQGWMATTRVRTGVIEGSDAPGM